MFSVRTESSKSERLYNLIIRAECVRVCVLATIGTVCSLVLCFLFRCYICDPVDTQRQQDDNFDILCDYCCSRIVSSGLFAGLRARQLVSGVFRSSSIYNRNPIKNPSVCLFICKQFNSTQKRHTLTVQYKFLLLVQFSCCSWNIIWFHSNELKVKKIMKHPFFYYYSTVIGRTLNSCTLFFSLHFSCLKASVHINEYFMAHKTDSGFRSLCDARCKWCVYFVVYVSLCE